MPRSQPRNQHRCTFIEQNGYRNVAYGNGLWVAVGTEGAIITSADGLDWAARNSGLSERMAEE